MQNAMELFEQGIPVTIEDSTLRMYLQGHRWGYHKNAEDLLEELCPACKKEEGNK
jgi:hypothetical protein